MPDSQKLPPEPLKTTVAVSGEAHQANAVRADWGGLQWMVSEDLGNSAEMTVGRVTIKSGEANPRHCHPSCEETLYLLSGQLVHTYGDREVAMQAGDTISIPAGVFHNARSVGEEDADMMVIFGSARRDFVLESPAE